MKHDVRNLSGHELDYAVLIAGGGLPEGYSVKQVEDYWVLTPSAPRKSTFLICSDEVHARFVLSRSQTRRMQPSVDWEFAGKVIETEGLSLFPVVGADQNTSAWIARRGGDEIVEGIAHCPTVAVSRWLVANRLGVEVEW